MPSKIEILEHLNLGSSVAENDENLTNYFVPTSALSDFLKDRYDLIRGAKGSGKSAILKVVSQKDYPELADVRLVVATEHTGEPAFKRAFGYLDEANIDESRMVNAWKIYLINLALDELEALPPTLEAKAATLFADRCKIRFRSTNTFKKMWWSLLRFIHIEKFSIGWEAISAEFPDAPPEFWTKSDEVIDFPEALRLCVAAFQAAKKRCWILVDRLDAAFQDRPRLEQMALRSLIVAYKDFIGHPALRPKLFFRTDLFDVVSTSGFRELTHVMDRTSPPIRWNQDNLLLMIMERFAFNPDVRQTYLFTKQSIQGPTERRAAFFRIFPEQIDPGTRRPDTWKWMCERIRDGNNVQTPRDLHALVKYAAEKQRERVALGEDTSSSELIMPKAIKAGLAELSKEKLSVTLIAENPDMETQIRAFEKKKAEQNAESLESLLGQQWATSVERLVRIGFLERIGNSWKVPMLYRDGLEITQGAAFQKSPTDAGLEDYDESEE